MIIYWDTLEKNAGDTARLPDYHSSEYFGGVSRIKSASSYPASSPYGAIRYNSALKKFFGFKEDTGWADLGGGAPAIDDIKCRVSLGSDQTLTDITFTKVLLDTEQYDIDGHFASNKFTVPVTGYYLVHGQVVFSAIIANKGYYVYLTVNGSAVTEAFDQPSNTLNDRLSKDVSDILYLTENQYVELYTYVNVGANTVKATAGVPDTFLTLHLLSL